MVMADWGVFDRNAVFDCYVRKDVCFCIKMRCVEHILKLHNVLNI
jgi:hypothetical protein